MFESLMSGDTLVRHAIERYVPDEIREELLVSYTQSRWATATFRGAAFIIRCRRGDYTMVIEGGSTGPYWFNSSTYPLSPETTTEGLLDFLVTDVNRLANEQKRAAENKAQEIEQNNAWAPYWIYLTETIEGDVYSSIRSPRQYPSDPLVFCHGANGRWTGYKNEVVFLKEGSVKKITRELVESLSDVLATRTVQQVKRNGHMVYVAPEGAELLTEEEKTRWMA